MPKLSLSENERLISLLRFRLAVAKGELNVLSEHFEGKFFKNSEQKKGGAYLSLVKGIGALLEKRLDEATAEINAYRENPKKNPLNDKLFDGEQDDGYDELKLSLSALVEKLKSTADIIALDPDPLKSKEKNEEAREDLENIAEFDLKDKAKKYWEPLELREYLSEEVLDEKGVTDTETHFDRICSCLEVFYEDALEAAKDEKSQIPSEIKERAEQVKTIYERARSLKTPSKEKRTSKELEKLQRGVINDIRREAKWFKGSGSLKTQKAKNLFRDIERWRRYKHNIPARKKWEAWRESFKNSSSDLLIKSPYEILGLISFFNDLYLGFKNKKESFGNAVETVDKQPNAETRGLIRVLADINLLKEKEMTPRDRDKLVELKEKMAVFFKKTEFIEENFKNPFIQAALLEYLDDISAIENLSIDQETALKELDAIKLDGDDKNKKEQLLGIIERAGLVKIPDELAEKIINQSTSRQIAIDKIKNPVIQMALREEPHLYFIGNLDGVEEQKAMSKINGVVHNPSMTPDKLVKLLQKMGFRFSTENVERRIKNHVENEIHRLHNIRYIHNRLLREIIERHPESMKVEVFDGGLQEPKREHAIKEINQLCRSPKDFDPKKLNDQLEFVAGIRLDDAQIRELQKAVEKANNFSAEGHNNPTYTRVGGKEGGANLPGEHGGWYENRDNGQRVFFKQDMSYPFWAKAISSIVGFFKPDIKKTMTSRFQEIRHHKIIAELISGGIGKELLGEKSADIFLTRYSGKTGPDGVYIGSVRMEGNFRELYVDIYEKAGKEAPSDRPKFAGSLNREIFHKGMLENGYQGFADISVASLIVADFDLHSGNVGVVDYDGKPHLVRIDYGASLENLESEVNPHSRSRHLPGLGPTNHFLEYPRELKLTPEFVAALERVANFPIEKLEKSIERSIDEVVDVYGEHGKNWPVVEKELREFGKWANMPNSDMLKGIKSSQKPEERVEKLKKNLIEFLGKRIEDRQKSLKEFALEIKFDLCLTKYDEGKDEGKKEPLRRLIKELRAENNTYFKDLIEGRRKFHFRDNAHRGGKVVKWGVPPTINFSALWDRLFSTTRKKYADIIIKENSEIEKEEKQPKKLQKKSGEIELSTFPRRAGPALKNAADVSITIDNSWPEHIKKLLKASPHWTKTEKQKEEWQYTLEEGLHFELDVTNAEFNYFKADQPEEAVLFEANQEKLIKAMADEVIKCYPPSNKSEILALEIFGTDETLKNKLREELMNQLKLKGRKDVVIEDAKTEPPKRHRLGGG